MPTRQALTLHTDWTREFSTVLSYQNSFYDYENSGGTFVAPGAYNQISISPPEFLFTGSLPSVIPSYAGLLNRVEQTFGLDLQWARFADHDGSCWL